MRSRAGWRAFAARRGEASETGPARFGTGHPGGIAEGFRWKRRPRALARWLRSGMCPMHRGAAFLMLAAPLFPALGCGGRVDSESGGGGQNASDAQTTPDCPPAAEVVGGVACTSPGLMCAGDTTSFCGAATAAECTCEGGAWHCLSTGPSGANCPPPSPPTPTPSPPPPIPVCPPPSEVGVDLSCALPQYEPCKSNIPVTDCPGNVQDFVTCYCVGDRWACPNPVMPVCADEGPDEDFEGGLGGCPPPDTFFAGSPCTSPGTQCAGDPTYCDGTVFYDAVQCQWDGSAWRWHAVAITECLDAGPNGDDGSAAREAGAQDSATPCGGNISFDLAVDASGLVFYGGPQPPWPTQNTCPYWLTIDHAGVALILERGNCNHSCAVSQPQDAGAQSFTWDGTYYPNNEPAGGECQAPACAPPGNYTATFCVASSLGDASWQEAPPTCKAVSFVWPPSTVNQVISETITPAPDGG
jgi:hypothetical protein